MAAKSSEHGAHAVTAVPVTALPMAADTMRTRPLARRGDRSTSALDDEFEAGSMCLEFVATAGRRGGADLLLTTAGLDSWLQEPGLPVPAGGLTEDDLIAARQLRAAIAGLARAVAEERPGAAADVRCINNVARRPTPVFLLQADGRRAVLVPEADLAPALAVIARDAIQLLTGPDLSRLRECAREGCDTLFYDRSPSGRRRWCSMKGCGEIVAAAAYRQRRGKLRTAPQ